MAWPQLEWISLEQSTSLAGLRLAVVRAGMPSPWSEFCRGLFDARGIPYAQVDARDPVSRYAYLRQLTAQESLPVAFWNEERPRTSWFEQVALAERLGCEWRNRPEWRGIETLIPGDVEERVAAYGICAELFGEGGFCWNRRLMLNDQLARPEATEQERRIGSYLATKYGSGGTTPAQAVQRCEATLAHLAATLRTQKDWGLDFLIGDALSIADLAWAVSAALLRPLPHEECPMLPLWRTLYTWTPASTSAEDMERLLGHRDAIYHTHLRLPVITA
jgi:glutathione S-transferase